MTQAFTFDESPRELRFGNEQRDPLTLLLAEMRRHQTGLNEMLAAMASDQFALQQAAGDVARAGTDHANDWAAVTIVSDRMASLLGRHGVTVSNPTGEPWSDAMRGEYDLLGHTLRDDLTEPRVAHVINPAVHRHGRLIRKGQVTVEAPRRKDA